MHPNDFTIRCLKTGNMRPIATLTDREAVASQQRQLATDCIEAARVLVGTRGEPRAIGQAYFAMEHKANELLARHGWEGKAHDCTSAALEILVKRPDLARLLADSYRDRKKYDYTHDPRDLKTGQALADLIQHAADFMREVENAMPR
jgi:uncharacterized protein (UPF0332 family)